MGAFESAFQINTHTITLDRYFIEISYNGANYSGWQSQSNSPSIQQTLQRTVSQVLKQEAKITGSSRTDAGVHALHQLAQFDANLSESIQQTIFKLNMALPSDISVLNLVKVKPNAKARYEATSRSYRYIISRRKDPFWVGRAYNWYGPLDLEKMNDCSLILLNTIDFQSFSKVNTDVNHFECYISKATWKEGNNLLLFEITGNRFLRGMVRALVGTILQVGKGKISVSDFEEILKSKDRKKAGENVPAYGLYLTKVEYPEDLKI